MPGLSAAEPQGVLRSGFCVQVTDYAIAGGWVLGGKLFVVGDASGAVSAFEGTTGKVRWANLNAHLGGVMDLAVSNEGRSLATVGQDGQLVLWSVSTGETMCRIDVAKGWAEHAVWSPNGTYLAVAAGWKACAFSAQGALTWASEQHSSTISALAWTSDHELATASYGRVTFFDVSSGKESQRLEWEGSLVSLVLSPNGDIVACGSQDNSVHFWRRSNGQDSMMSGYPSKPSALAFSQDGTVLATSGGEAITVWSFAGGGPEGTRPVVLEVHAAAVSALAFSHRQRRLASGGRDSGVVVWDMQQDGSGKAMGTALASAAVEQVYFRPDDRGLAAIDAAGGVSVWRVR